MVFHELQIRKNIRNHNKVFWFSFLGHSKLIASSNILFKPKSLSFINIFNSGSGTAGQNSYKPPQNLSDPYKLSLESKILPKYRYSNRSRSTSGLADFFVAKRPFPEDVAFLNVLIINNMPF